MALYLSSLVLFALKHLLDLLFKHLVHHDDHHVVFDLHLSHSIVSVDLELVEETVDILVLVHMLSHLSHECFAYSSRLLNSPLIQEL